MFIDTHCHLNHEQFEDELDAAIKRAESVGVGRMIVVGFDVESSERAVELAESYSSLYAAVAVHPHDAKNYGPEAESRIRELAGTERVVALGEIGLDFHYDFSERDDQYRAFRSQLALAAELGLPVIIHCREAYPETLGVLEEGLNRHAGGVMHCWAGDSEDARRALELGMYLGFGGVVTFKNADSVRQVLEETPVDRILLETDAPYLAPVPYRGKRNEPSYVPLIAAKVSEVTGRDLGVIESATTDNALLLFTRIAGSALAEQNPTVLPRILPPRGCRRELPRRPGRPGG